MKIGMLVCLVLAISAAPAVAQEQQLVVGSEFEQKLDELATWLSDYQAWEKWFEVWGNRVFRNFDGQPVWERPKRPEPPVWLAEECQDYIGGGTLLDTACEILRHWDEDPVRILQRRRLSLATSSGKVDEKIVKTSFLQRVHVTGLWMQARYPAIPAYGIVGMQVAVFQVGRFAMPAIGVMAVVIPDGHGGHDWKPATTVGVGYRLCDFVAPVIARQASLHLNLARTNIHAGPVDRTIPGTTNVNLFGLSVSVSRRR